MGFKKLCNLWNLGFYFQTCKSLQEWPTLIFSYQYKYIIKRNGYESDYENKHQWESGLIFYQILSTNS